MFSRRKTRIVLQKENHKIFSKRKTRNVLQKENQKMFSLERTTKNVLMFTTRKLPTCLGHHKAGQKHCMYGKDIDFIQL